ncbi:hypothetical protein Golomagni_05780 [Golovinomyces magnicellulatus]|nr:hypothetical protein Golomagni_05780 [Golovinomyces magnicellulatus]
MQYRSFFPILFLALAPLTKKVATCQEVSENAQSITQSSNTTSFINAVYFTNWGTYDRNFQPNDISLQFITHVFYAFLDVRPDGTVYLSDTYPDLEKHYPADYKLILPLTISY